MGRYIDVMAAAMVERLRHLEARQWAAAHEGRRLPLHTRCALALYFLYKSIDESDLSVRASAQAWTFIFSLIPLLTTSLAFVTAFPGLSTERDRIANGIFKHLLPSAVGSVQHYMSEFSSRAAQAGAVSSVVFVAVVLLLFQGIERNFNLIWKVARNRSWGARLQALSVFFLVGALAAALMITVLKEWQRVSEQLGEPGTEMKSFMLSFTDWMAACAVFVVANKVLPNTRVHFLPALVGGVVAGTLWDLLKSAFTWYVENWASYENIYGTLGTIPAFFLWVYLSMGLLMGGAHLAFVVQNFQALVDSRRFAGVGSEGLGYVAVAVMAALDDAFSTGKGPRTVEELAEAAGISPYLVERALPALEGEHLVLSVGTTENARYALGTASDVLTVGRIVSVVSGENLQAPQGMPSTPLHTKLQKVFDLARCEEGSVLERVRLKELATS